MSYVLNFKHWTKLNENFRALNEAFEGSTDYAAAAKVFKSKHKGSWGNVAGQFMQYAGNEFFITLKIGANPMNEQNFSVFRIQKNKNGVPLPHFRGTVWITDAGLAKGATPGDPLNYQVWYPNVTAGWANLKSGDITAITEAGCTGEVWKAYCTKFGAKYGVAEFGDHVKRNLKLYEAQPSGLAGELWLAIKPAIDAAKMTATTAAAPVKKP